MGEQYKWDDDFIHYHHYQDSNISPSISTPERQMNGNKRGLSAFAQDLLARAKNGELDPVIGRERELERVIQILNRKTKRNPILVGDPGVGKTAIVYGLAQRIAKREVPPTLQGKKIYALNVSSLVAGTMFRGDFEARLETVIKEIKRQGALLFIDEIHNVVGAGQAMGALDAANMLKPALAEGEIQVIGSTTYEEYKFYIESDKALERRFQPVFVDEPSLEEAIDILKGLKGAHEQFHHIKISEEAIDAAVRLSDRYIQDRFLPDKALDVLDEACAIAAISKNFGKEVKKIESLRAQALAVREKKEKELKQGFYEEAFALKREEELLSKKALSLEKINQEKMKPSMVAEPDVRRVVATITGIPLEEVSLMELKKLRTLHEDLCKEVVGQEEAIEALSAVIRRSRVGLNFHERPLGSFLFVGPTGVGKTELARVLARRLFGQDSFIKLDMSEFMEPHSVSRLIGAPAGYVGYGRGGELTEKVRRNPYSLVLFDEIEKAHPQIFNLLLQVLEDGELSDSMGLEVDFKNTIIILTSNLGTEFLSKNKKLIGFRSQLADVKDTANYEEIKKEILTTLQQALRPEFLNRIDDVVVFKTLEVVHIKKIVALQLDRLTAHLLEGKQLNIKWSKSLIDWLAQKSHESDQGARLIRRTIEREIADPLAAKIVSGDIRPGKTVTLQVRPDARSIEFVF